MTQNNQPNIEPCDTTQDELAKLFHQCIKNDFRYFLCTTTYCPLGIHNDDSCKTNWFPLLPFSSFIGQNISFMLSSRFQLRDAWAMTNMYIHAFSRSKMIFKANLRSRLTIFWLFCIVNPQILCKCPISFVSITRSQNCINQYHI